MPDIDPIETQEWLESLASLVEFESKERAEFILKELSRYAHQLGLKAEGGVTTPYVNTIPANEEIPMPDDGVMMTKLTNILRWNAIAMVMRAGKFAPELGGHIASFASSATLYEVGFQYFFRGPDHECGGDLVYIQGHSSPGIYARAYLEGRLTEEQIGAFRQEVFSGGVSSYPHPWLMPDFWQFPTVSMGLGPLMAIYQARFLKYQQHRGLVKHTDRTVWMYCGDGELGEPESLGALNIAAREKLDNLIFVINCNLQRLDGPVWGNGQIIQEYEGVFRGAGWNVIKVIWGGEWEALFAKDTSGKLLQRISELVDGEYQDYSAKDGAFMRENFFGKYPELLALVEDMSDEDLKKLRDGGHDPRKVYAAYAAAMAYKEGPTVILAKTVKGYGMGDAGEAKNVTHQTKKLPIDGLKAFRSRFDVLVTDEQLENLSFIKPDEKSAEMKYLHAQRKALGGYLPSRNMKSEKLTTPPLESFGSLLEDSGDRDISTTMAYVRALGVLLKDAAIKERIVPIVADESRTFGMEGLFRQIGIYSPFGQKYEPEDRKTLMYYREDQKGQLIQDGISEAGAMSSWIAAATSYQSSHLPMIPFYIYYSMFGFQRFGDLVWAAGDICARGFIIGATAGRTTLAGEGLQHQDGHNIFMYSFVPNCVSYDPTFAYEMVVILRHGLERMYVKQENVFFYITAMNENYHHPAMPDGVEEGIIKGMYRFKSAETPSKQHVQLLGSGAILNEVIKAAEILKNEFNVTSDIWSVTSFNQLRRDIETVYRENRLHPEKAAEKAYVTTCLENQSGPVIAATDYIKMFADQIRAAIPQRYYVLGTNGFGRSDTRAALRYFFEVDANMIAYTALKALLDEGAYSQAQLLQAMKKLNIDTTKPEPWTV